MMMSSLNDGVYADWLCKWRVWRKTWIESDDPVVYFHLQFLAKMGKYSPDDHGDFAARVSETIGSTTIDRQGTLQVNNHATVRPTISMIEANSALKDTLHQDRFGIVSLNLEFFSRLEILKIALILEGLGHGVIHDSGRVVSRGYSKSKIVPKQMPFRDDPIWNIVETMMQL